MGYLPIYLDVIFSLVREKKQKNTCFRKLRRGLRVVRNLLGVKVLYHVQSIYFLNKVCTRDHELSFKKKLILYNNPTQRYGRNKINAKLLLHPLFTLSIEFIDDVITNVLTIDFLLIIVSFLIRLSFNHYYCLRFIGFFLSSRHIDLIIYLYRFRYHSLGFFF